MLPSHNAHLSSLSTAVGENAVYFGVASSNPPKDVDKLVVTVNAASTNPPENVGTSVLAANAASSNPILPVIRTNADHIDTLQVVL